MEGAVGVTGGVQRTGRAVCVWGGERGSAGETETETETDGWWVAPRWTATGEWRGRGEVYAATDG